MVLREGLTTRFRVDLILKRESPGVLGDEGSRVTW